MSLNFVEKAKKIIIDSKKANYIRTGCTLLDMTVGGGKLGFPPGRIINLVGDKSSGKTFVANEIIANSYHSYGDKLQWNFDDCEDGFTFDTKHLYGFDLVGEGLGYSSNKVEDLDGNFVNFLDEIKSGNLGIYVVDSLDGLSNIEIEKRSKDRAKAVKVGKDFDEGTYNMGTAAFLSKEFFRTKASQIADKDVLFIIISQIRDNINAGLYGKKSKRAGGRAMDFYAHSCLWLTTLQKIKKTVKGQICTTGVVVKVRADKNKTSRPFRECIFSLYFDYGIDNIGSNLDYLFNLRSAKNGELLKIAEEISWDGQSKTLPNYKKFLEENNILDLARQEKKEETNKKALSIDWLEEWIQKDEKRKKAADTYFVDQTYTRDELIAMVENDPKMEEELELRVIAKWEEIEDQVSSKRRKKY